MFIHNYIIPFFFLIFNGLCGIALDEKDNRIHQLYKQSDEQENTIERLNKQLSIMTEKYHTAEKQIAELSEEKRRAEEQLAEMQSADKSNASKKNNIFKHIFGQDKK